MTESIDLFAGGISYGLARVRVSFVKVFIINIVGKVVLGGAFFIGFWVGHQLPNAFGIWACFAILGGLGVAKIWGAATHKGIESPPRGDIGVSTSVLLGVVLSLDGGAMALGMTLAALPFAFVWVLLLVKFVTDQGIFMMANWLGLRVCGGRRAYGRLGELLAGGVIILVAVVKLAFDLC